MLVDTHAHIYTEEFDEDLSTVLDAAHKAGISEIYMPNIDITSIKRMHDVEKKFPHCHAMMGLHPCSVTADYQRDLEIIFDHLKNRAYAAVGEIGIDLYWDQTFVKEQEKAFRLQIEKSIEYKLPIVIHSRDSLDMTIDIVSEYVQPDWTGIFHCFTGTSEQAQKIVSLGFFLGIGGVLTYKNAGLDLVLESVDLNHMVLETDSPYLAPVPYRGKRNQPAYIKDVAVKLASIKGTTIEQIEMITSMNVKKIFTKHTHS